MQLLNNIKKQYISNIHINTNIQLILLYTLIFITPALVQRPQILTGSLVNFLLTYTVLKYGLKKSQFTIFLPSISALLTGLLFGNSTIFLMYLIPFIIISNLILVAIINYKKNLVSCIIGSIFKSIFLFSITNILINTVGLPSLFAVSMGYIQLYTALIGSISALLIHTLITKNSTS